MNDSVIEANQVTKKYRSVLALDGVSLRVSPGSIYGLIGDNGAGKSTLLKLLAGHVFPTAGEIRLFGQAGERELLRCRRQMGVIIEHPGFFPNMTVEHTLEYYRIQKGVPGRKKVEQIMELVGILEKRREKCKCLSLGQKQRLGLAIALLGEPAALVLDEPVNGLDPQGIIEIRELILKLNRERQITVLISSHILDELARLATHYGFIDGGRMVRELSAQELEASCRKCVRVEVTGAQALARVLDGMGVEYKILSDRTADVFAQLNVSQLTLALAKEDCEVLSMQERDESLESFFINLVGGGSDD